MRARVRLPWAGPGWKNWRVPIRIEKERNMSDFETLQDQVTRSKLACGGERHGGRFKRRD